MKRFLAVSVFLVLVGAGCVANQAVKPTTSTNQDAGSNAGAVPSPAIPSLKEGATGVALDLSGKGLTKIPSDVFARTDLEQLDLSNNKLTGAPQAEIRHLVNLKVLNLSGNALTGLPAELGQLQRLDVLDVSNNQLTGLPLELGNLTQLRVLDLRGNAYSTQDLDQISAKLQNTDIRR